MPKILITGNGFDLNLNLPTAYQDFIRITSFVQATNVKKWKFDDVYKNVGDWKYNKLKENIDKDFSFDKNNIEALKEKIIGNVWFDFFETELEIETWIDFETKINYVLNIIVDSTTLINRILFLTNQETNPKYPKGQIISSLLNGNVEYYKILTTFQLITINDYAKTEEINEEYLIQKYDSFLGFNHEKITNFLHEQLNEFIEIFCMYFRIFVYPLYDYVKQHVNNDWFKEIDYHFTFNYTPSFEKLYNSSKKTKTFFLHGKIESDKNNIVLGVNEMPESVINRKFYFPFTKYYQKLNKDTDYQFLNTLKYRDTMNIELYIWGHSLDISDADYINEIFDFIDKKKKDIQTVRKIVVIYHNKDSKSNLLLNLLHIRGKNDIESKMKDEKLLFIESTSSELKTLLNKELEPDYNSSYRPVAPSISY
ncbi:Bacteriophage abortive infection AbiH [Flexibacter flexilis DSM 6793]|uniref:Bacteriophage abortive infection AbiH n=2 Tax=Flexibacter flexilis TaxID=998 RepID=A0A1I1LTI8_9BACT|nr:Bacteriophage abortive infection AbiH [Flexibacter flexilis DSM 6793]